jgi:hypothetical protein
MKPLLQVHSYLFAAALLRLQIPSPHGLPAHSASLEGITGLDGVPASAEPVAAPELPPVAAGASAPAVGPNTVVRPVDASPSVVEPSSPTPIVLGPLGFDVTGGVAIVPFAQPLSSAWA